jgi:RNA polymerase sigma factor (sigma-70 family)
MPDLLHTDSRLAFLHKLEERIARASEQELEDLRGDLPVELRQQGLSLSEACADLADETLALAVRRSLFPKVAFEELFARRYLTRDLPRWLAFWGATREEAEDIAQELTLHFWTTRLASYHPDRAFAGYLYSAARNRWCDLRRRHRSGRETTIDWDFPSSEPGPVETAARGELLERVRAALKCLPATEAQVIEEILKGKTVDEICRDLNLERLEVYRLRFTARRNLERLLRVESPPFNN